MKRWVHASIGLLAVLTLACGNGTDKKADPQGEDALRGDGGDVTAACVEGTLCDDGDPCTANDLCTDGVCAGQAYSCDSECATAACDGEGGCAEPTVSEGWCRVEDLCVEDGAEKPGDPCFVCDVAQSTSKFVFAPPGTACEDGNICTEDDFCDNGDCLAGSPPTCADGKQCTVDICDAELGCLHEPNHERCDDNKPCTADLCEPENGDELGCTNLPDDTLTCADKNVCTTNDHCDNGLCVSDPVPLDCDDDNPCTNESCHPSYGCLYVFHEDPCDDGASCTDNDVCSFGKCLGEEKYWGACPACDLTFSDQSVKIIALRVGDGGFPGEALNVDNDLKTCSPQGNCEQGLDNSLVVAGDFIDETIEQNLYNLENPLIFAAEMVEPDFEGSEFLLNIYYATLADSNPACDFQHEVCEYDVSGLNFSPLCENQVTFDNAKIADGVLTAGGSGYIFPFKASFANGEKAETVLYAAKVQATVTEGGKVTAMDGVIGGAITKENLVELIMAIPEEYLPVDPELLVTFVEAIPQDIDLDGDGTLDASSIALVFKTIPAILLPYNK